jgi:hypothetical protein
MFGTFFNRYGTKSCVFKRTISSYPEVNEDVHIFNKEKLDVLMNSLINNNTNEKQLILGNFVINEDVPAIIDGNKFFQKHAAILGSTGSGKSWCVANIIEKVNKLNYSNIIIFDLHGEYNELPYAKQIKVSSNLMGSKPNVHNLNLPLWFFTIEEIFNLFSSNSDYNAANQRAVVSSWIIENKKELLTSLGLNEMIDSLTTDTPIPFSTEQLINQLIDKDKELLITGKDKDGNDKTKQGPHYGTLTRMINRFMTKYNDKKYAFMFEESTDTNKLDYLNIWINNILGLDSRIKVIDLSEVPSDILNVTIGIITRMIYNIQFWNTPSSNKLRHPICFVCDEAHIYMPANNDTLNSVDRKSLEIFERISKEGRKYGVGLLVVSQRPSELNTTILTQVNNYICLKLTNDRDKSAVKSMLTDSLEGVIDVLPNLDTGECVIIGDSILLPTRVKLDEPEFKPKSSTIDFWDEWENKNNTEFDYDKAINNLRYQFRKE